MFSPARFQRNAVQVYVAPDVAPRNDTTTSEAFSGEKPALSNRVWRDEPVFKVRFRTQDAFKRFEAVLKAHTVGMDLAGKVECSPDEQTICIHYLPRLVRKLIPLEAMRDLRDQAIGAIEPHADALGDGDLNARDPYSVLFSQMSATYARQQQAGFEWRARAWQTTCLEAGLSALRTKPCDTQYEAGHADFCRLFESLCEQSIVLGEKHDENHQFLQRNLAWFGRRGYDTLFLEGLHYEVQPMLDAWFDSPDDEPGPELKALLGNMLDLVVQAKAAGIRAVGIDSEQTYVVATPNEPLYARAREAAMNDFACEIVNLRKGRGKFIVHGGSDHALRSGSGTPGMAAVLNVPAVIVRNTLGMRPEHFRLLSGTDTCFVDEEAYVAYVAHQEFSSVECPRPGRRNPACDVWIEASPDANWSLG